MEAYYYLNLDGVAELFQVAVAQPEYLVHRVSAESPSPSIDINNFGRDGRTNISFGQLIIWLFLHRAGSHF